MGLIKSISTIASSSMLTQVIGASSIWFVSNRYGMNEVGIYAMVYSIVLIGAQICTFASQLLIPKQQDEHLAQNIVFCLIQTVVLAIPFTAVIVWLFNKPFALYYLLTLAHAWILISENLLLRDEKMKLLAFQRLLASGLVLVCVLMTPTAELLYWSWAIALIVIVFLWLLYSMPFRRMAWNQWSWSSNKEFFKRNKQHIVSIGSAEVLAMANSNLPTVLINYWFSAVTAGYFAIVSRFCLSPVVIVGNAVRNSIFSKWSLDFRNQRFNYPEFIKVRKLLFVLGLIATAGVFIFYPIVMEFAAAKNWITHEWVESIPTSRYMLPYLFPALAICPLTVIELVFGSPKYFLRIQLEQLAVVVMAFVILPYFYNDYAYSVTTYAVLSAVRYGFIYLKVNQRARSMREGVEAK